MPARFDPGRIGITSWAADALRLAHYSPRDLLVRHAEGDWGDVSAGDRQSNEQALHSGAELCSSYTLPDGTRVLVVTEAADAQGRRDRTLILLPFDL